MNHARQIDQFSCSKRIEFMYFILLNSLEINLILQEKKKKIKSGLTITYKVS